MVIVFFLVKSLSWHSGTSVLISTVKQSSGDLMDVTVVITFLLVGFGIFGYGLLESLEDHQIFLPW